MGRVGKRINRVISLHPYAYAMLLNACIFLLIGLTRGFVFETVDDYNVMMTLSGDKTGQPFWQVTFFNSIAGLILSGLYRLVPIVQWYSVMQIALLFVSECVICALIIEKCQKQRRSVTLATALYVFVFVVALLYPTRRLQFTTTSGVLGMAACASLFSIDEEFFGQRAFVSRVSQACLLLLGSFVVRRSAGICISAFFLIGLIRIALDMRGVYRDKAQYRHELFGFARNVLVYALIALVFVAGHLVILRYGANAGYPDYDKWRAQYQDHPHAAYEGNESLYDSVGWSKEEYDVAQKLIYMGDYISEDAFETLATSKETQAVQKGFLEALRMGLSVIKNHKAARGLMALLLSLFVSVFILIGQCPRFFKRDAVAVASYGFAACAMAVLLALYLCLSGRWMLRLFQVVALPCLSILLFTVIEMLSFYEVQQGRHGASARYAAPILVIFVVGWVLGWGFNVAENLDEAMVPNDRYTIAQMRSVEQYAIDHPDDVFIHDYSISNTYDSYDPFRVYVGKKPTNLIVSGGSYTYTAAYYEQLKINSLESLTGDTLLRDNVYYISDRTRANGSYLASMTEYLRSEYGNVTVQVVDELKNNAAVYKFVLEDEYYQEGM